MHMFVHGPFKFVIVSHSGSESSENMADPSIDEEEQIDYGHASNVLQLPFEDEPLVMTELGQV